MPSETVLQSRVEEADSNSPAKVALIASNTLGDDIVLTLVHQDIPIHQTTEPA